ncbi:MAG: HAD family phosphatase [Sedimentisphaerales bacterium]|nr:HAD family phosphatase [Sedimentisphaerales bacterium]
MTLEQARGVIFDLDGVLVDTAEYHRRSWYDLAAREGWAHYSDELFYESFGKQNAVIIPRLAGRSLTEEEINEMADYKELRYRERINGKLSLLPGVRELLADLKKHGFRLAIGTSTPKVNLDMMLDTTGTRDCFDEFVTSDEITRGKPAPDTFLIAAKKLGLSPINCVVVEDAIPGVQAALAGGMAVLAVTNTRTREDLYQASRIVDSLTEVSAADFMALLQRAADTNAE